jgi:PAS domain S-box-containing protein
MKKSGPHPTDQDVMKAEIASPSLPPRLLEILLRRAPVDVLLFDAALVCRYAAPAGETLFGQTAAELVGRSVSEVFPTQDGLAAMIEAVLHQDGGWRDPGYRIPRRTEQRAVFSCWSVTVEPVTTTDFTGVLITLADVKDLADEVESLRHELESLRHENEQSRLVLQERVRTRLTPALGYLQVLSRGRSRCPSRRRSSSSGASCRACTKSSRSSIRRLPTRIQKTTPRTTRPAKLRPRRSDTPNKMHTVPCPPAILSGGGDAARGARAGGRDGYEATSPPHSGRRRRPRSP